MSSEPRWNTRSELESGSSNRTAGTSQRFVPSAKPSGIVSTAPIQGRNGRLLTRSGGPPGTRSTTRGRSRTEASPNLAGLSLGADGKQARTPGRDGSPRRRIDGMWGTHPASHPRGRSSPSHLRDPWRGGLDRQAVRYQEGGAPPDPNRGARGGRGHTGPRRG